MSSSLLFVEVELMETEDLLQLYYAAIESLLFVEVELMETSHPSQHNGQGMLVD